MHNKKQPSEESCFIHSIFWYLFMTFMVCFSLISICIFFESFFNYCQN